MSEHDETAAEIGLSFGETVFDEQGNPLGTVRGLDDHGFYVTFEDGIEALSAEHVTSGIAGEAELMWRCLVCGEMGELDDDLPDTCPNCGESKENLYYWTED